MSDFVDYLRKWFRLEHWLYQRELGRSGMDNEGFRRDWVGPDAIEGLSEVGRWRDFNWYVSNAYTLPNYYDVNDVLFDRVVLDLDSEEDPTRAVRDALALARRINEEFGAVPLVVRSGFKGAHVIVFYEKPVNWDVQSRIFEYLRLLAPNPGIVDKGMNQWNRLARVPLTYNLKSGKRRLAEIIYPERVRDFGSFSWSLIKPLDPGRVKVPVIEVREVPTVRVVGGVGKRRIEWVERLIRAGARDGRKRLIGLAILPYLANYLGLSDEEVLAACREFIENSCRNFRNCGKIYNSWLRSQLRTVRARGYRVVSLEKLRREYPEVYEIVSELMRGGSEKSTV